MKKLSYVIFLSLLLLSFKAKAQCGVSQQCVYTFSTTESFGDGWNGNTLSVFQNGNLVTTFSGPTSAQGQGPVIFPVSLCDNEPFELYWNAVEIFRMKSV